MKQYIKICLWTQLFSLIFAVLAFSLFESPRTAGSMTGPVFLLSGAMPFFGLIARRMTFKQISVWGSLIFTVLFSGPMLFKRLALYGTEFSEISYYGISSSMFHRISSAAYLVLFGLLLLDLYRLHKKSQIT